MSLEKRVADAYVKKAKGGFWYDQYPQAHEKALRQAAAYSKGLTRGPLIFFGMNALQVNAQGDFKFDLSGQDGLPFKALDDALNDLKGLRIYALTFMAEKVKEGTGVRMATQDLPEEDRTTHPVVVEYAVQEMLKHKTPSVAAKATFKKLNGIPNHFLGSVVPTVDPKRLEEALWGRLVDNTFTNLSKVREGKEDFALGMTLSHFGQKDSLSPELKARVIKKLRFDPFSKT